MRARAEVPFAVDPVLLQTVEGCSRAMRQVKAERIRIHGLLQQAERPSRTSSAERAWAAGLRAEWERLGLMHDEVKARRHELTTDDRLRWERTFVHVAHDLLDETTYQRVADEARRRVDAQQRLAHTASVGAALPMRAGSGSMKVRS